MSEWKMEFRRLFLLACLKGIKIYYKIITTVSIYVDWLDNKIDIKLINSVFEQNMILANKSLLADPCQEDSSCRI